LNFISHISSNNQYRRFRRFKQRWISIDPKPMSEIVQNSQTFFKGLTEAQRAVLNYLLVWSNSYRNMYFSQSTIARDLGYSRGFVNRTLYIFEQSGLIASNYRHKTSCLYKVSSWFDDLDIRESLRGLFKAFRWFPVALLLVRAPGSVTQEKSYIYNNNQVNIPYKDNSDYIYRSTGDAVKKVIEIMKNWKPAGNVLPADQSELFRDTRLKRNSSVGGGYKATKNGDDDLGSKKSNRAWNREHSTTEHLRKQGQRLKELDEKCMRMAYLTQKEIDTEIAQQRIDNPDWCEYSIKAYLSDIEKGKRLLKEHGIKDFFQNINEPCI